MPKGMVQQHIMQNASGRTLMAEAVFAKCIFIFRRVAPKARDLLRLDAYLIAHLLFFESLLRACRTSPNHTEPTNKLPPP